MRLSRINVTNFRSIKATGDIRIEQLQAFVGENNCGKSNLLRAIECFLTSGLGGVTPGDFNDQAAHAAIECEFSGLSDAERRKLKPYLLGDRVVLRKELRIVVDEERNKKMVKAEYHGYQAEPREFHYSLKKIEERDGSRARWAELAEAGGFLDYAKTSEDKVNKTSFKAGLDRYLLENEVEYDVPTLGATQALGIPQNLLAALPEFYLLPAITDYSDEIDRRSSSTVFRKLMGDLSERLLRGDPRYQEIEQALTRIRALLNMGDEQQVTPRLMALGTVENQLRDVVKKLMPSVHGVSLSVDVEEPKDIFAKGVSIKVNDGVLTDVLDKGHGMQRCLVFALLQMLIQSVRASNAGGRPIILAIEEPELYIHPHCQRLIFSVLKGFAGVDQELEHAVSDQVLYTTHATSFIEVARYERVAVVRKPDSTIGTLVYQCEEGVLGSPDEKKTFKLLTSFGLKHNELFFARDVILVEGPEDEVGIVATARKMGYIKDLPDELGLSIIVTDGKGGMPKFQKVLNAFGITYGVLYEADGKTDNHGQNAPILDNINGNRLARVPNRVEDLLGVGRHFDDQRHAKEFFSVQENINADMERLVTTLLPVKMNTSH